MARIFAQTAGDAQGTGGPRPLSTGAVAVILLTAALWGGTPVAVKYSTDTLPPIAVSGIRFALAAVFMLFWCRLEGSSLRLKSGQLFPCVVLGMLLFAQISLFTVAIDWSNASHGSLLINTFIFAVAAIEHFITREHRLSVAGLVGLVIAAGGAALIVLFPGEGLVAGESDSPSLSGDAVMLVSAMLLGIKIVYTKQAVKSVEPGKLIFWHDVIGMVFFALFSVAFEETAAADFTMPAVWGLLYQGVVVAGFCFAVQAVLLKRYSASQLSVFSFSTPLFGVSLAVLFRGDRLSGWLSIAAVLVAAGILIVNRQPLAKPDAAD